MMKAQSLGVLYGDDDWAPIADRDLARLLDAAGIWCGFRSLVGRTELVTPPICGRHIMLIDTPAGAARQFAVRHGLGHVLAGHVDEPSFPRDWHDPHSHEERTADLFALLDLIPDRQLREWPEAERAERVWAEILAYAPTWPSERVADRISLRLAVALP